MQCTEHINTYTSYEISSQESFMWMHYIRLLGFVCLCAEYERICRFIVYLLSSQFLLSHQQCQFICTLVSTCVMCPRVSLEKEKVVHAPMAKSIEA